MTFNRVLILLSVICFVLAIFVTVPFNLLALGLALYAAASLV